MTTKHVKQLKHPDANAPPSLPAFDAQREIKRLEAEIAKLKATLRFHLGKHTFD